MTPFEQSAIHLAPPQVDGLLRDIVTTHLDKFESLAAAAKSFPGLDQRKPSATTVAPHGLIPPACARGT